MSFDAKLGTSEILRRLGIDAPRHYAIGSEPLTPTMQVLDLSRSIATEPIEARGYKQTEVFGGFGGWHFVSLNAGGLSGGLVVERVEIEEPLGAMQAWFTIAPIIDSQFDPGFTDLDPLSVGGVPVRARLWQAVNLVDRPAPANWEAINQEAVREARLFVPSGFRLTVQSAVFQGRLALAILWRELQP